MLYQHQGYAPSALLCIKHDQGDALTILKNFHLNTNVTASVKTLNVSVFYIASQKGYKTFTLLAIFKCFIPKCNLVL